MTRILRFDHVGVTVADLDVVTAFFVALGLEVEGRTFVEGEFLDTVCGIPGSRTEIVMLKPPGDGTRLELSSFVRPEPVPGSPAAMANELGRAHQLSPATPAPAAIRGRWIGREPPRVFLFRPAKSVGRVSSISTSMTSSRLAPPARSMAWQFVNACRV
jgi:catechol 2,3-dioxygenase-like lactoylglutathione lyase family enzyme